MNRKLVLVITLAMLASLGFSFQPAAAPAPLAAPTPTAVPDQYRWDLDAMYPDTAAWEKDFATVKGSDIAKYKDYEGKLGDPAQLAEMMKMDEETCRKMDKLYQYASMKRDEDQTNSTYTEMAARASSLYSDLDSAGSYFRPELLALPEETLKGYKTDTRLSKYAHLFDELLMQKAHTLDKNGEKLLAMAGDMASAPETISTKIREADAMFPKIKDKTGKEIQLSEDQYSLLLGNPDRDLRKRAFEAMLSTYGNSKNSLATALDSQVRKDIFFAKARKYDSSLAASVENYNIPVAVYTNLLAAADKNLPALQKYITLRKNVLKLDKVHTYDLLVSLVPSYEKKVTYEESKKLLNDGLAPLGKDYLTAMNTGFNSHWIDVYPAPHKTSGAYSWGTYDSHPYILANYNDTVDGLLEIGHEMGHALNSFYTNKTEPFTYANQPIFTAEVASTTNEMLMLNFLLKNAKDDTEKLYYLDKMAENVRGTFFVQVMYAEFEKEIHERVEKGDALSVESLNEMWGSLVTKFYGPDFALDDLAKANWMRIPHFYYNFYVYQYATGLAASNQFVSDMSAGKTGVVEAYLQFLSAGSSDYPVEVLKKAGVDMTSAAPVDNLLADFSKILDQMETILVKQGKIKK